MTVAYIASGDAFAAGLAKYLLKTYPDRLHDVIVFLPSQRARRALTEALLVANDGRALLMPRLFPLADADSELLIPEVIYGQGTDTLSPAIGEMERLAKLARLIEKTSTEEMNVSAEETFHMAQSFAALSDEFMREQQPLAALETLVPEEMAEHWQASLELLSVMIHAWPELLEREGKMDLLERRNRTMALLAEHWKAHPPEVPVIAAGTTGSIPATAKLLDVIKSLPQGLVVLPGLDCGMPEEEWALLNPTHPQYGLKHVLNEMNISRRDVNPLQRPATGASRTDFLRAVMTPPACTHAWKNAALDWENALEGITLVSCRDEHEEASVITLMLRQVLEQKEKKAMLVTHDRVLARQVSSMMRRYKVEIDDSAGIPLTDTAPFVFFHHIIAYALSDGDPLALLALLKHPLLRLDRQPIEIREAARHLEKHMLRGVRSWSNAQQLEETSKREIKDNEEAAALVARLHRAMVPLLTKIADAAVPFADLLREHWLLAEELAAPEGIAGTEEGKQLLACLEVVKRECAGYGNVLPREYLGILSLMLAGKSYRKKHSAHPRLHILSPLEARMQQADYVILGGLNEESWPPAPAIDSWLSLLMREQAGLKPHAHQVGLSAHDFWMLAHAPNVMITHAKRKRGAPMTSSRWLLRMQTLLEAAPTHVREAFWEKGKQWLYWQDEHAKAAAIPAAIRPAPKPALEVRPKALSVTRVKTLRDDPYAFYAEKILHFKKLDAINKAPDHAEFGTAVHAALKRFFTDYSQLPEYAEDVLYTYLSEEIHRLLVQSRASLFWQQRLRFIASRAVALTRQRPPARLQLEKKIEWLCGAVRLDGRIDRQEIYADGAAIIDYKTGNPPRESEILQGVDPQLGLFGMMVAKVEGIPVCSVEIWPLKGKMNDEKSVVIEDREKVANLLTQTEQGITALLEAFAKPETGYVSLADQQSHDGDYDHLARKGEWA